MKTNLVIYNKLHTQKSSNSPFKSKNKEKNNLTKCSSQKCTSLHSFYKMKKIGFQHMNSEFWEDVNIQYITNEKVVRVVRIKRSI